MNSCKVCDAPTIEISDPNLRMAVPSGYHLDGELSLAVCETCNFVFNVSSSGGEDYETYYSQLNKHHERAGALAALDQDYFEGLCDFIEAQGNFSFEGARILDFGSGALQFASIARARGASIVDCFDVGDDPPDTKYDLIVSTHCFEHIYEPREQFAFLAGLLADRGVVAVAVPDLEGYANAYYGPYAHFDLEHINHFSAESLRALMASQKLVPRATRRGERRVTPTLAYAEVLVLGVPTFGLVDPGQIATNANPDPVGAWRSEPAVRELLRRSRTDFDVTLRTAVEALNQRNEGVEAGSRRRRVGLFGLSSYAFRVTAALNGAGCGTLDFFADSDSRLAKFSMGTSRILDKAGFSTLLDRARESGETVVVLVAAVNGHRIVDMLEGEFQGFDLEVMALPPDCQNRGEGS
jgi:hypothetical protein